MHLSPAAYVIQCFGGVRKTARTVGRHHTSVLKWRKPRAERGLDGEIPGVLRKTILAKAKELGLDITSQDLDFGRDVPEQVSEAS